MKKIAGIFVLIAFVSLLTGCGKKSENDPTDNSRSYECILEKNTEDEYSRAELIVSVDGTGQITTYNEIESASYKNEELYKKICAEKVEFEKAFQEKKYENSQFSQVCSDENLTMSSNKFFDYQNLTEEEKGEMQVVTKHVTKEGKFDSKKWMDEQTKEGYTCA